MDLGLRNRVYVVTGGTRGLGLATARRLVAEEACVVISGRDGCDAVRVAAELGDSALGVGIDHTDPNAADQLVAAAIGRFGTIDGALISMGGSPAGAVAHAGDDTWRYAFESVFLAAVRIARAVAAATPAGGALAFVLGASVRSPQPGLGSANGLRPGLAMVAKTLADELGPRGIRVNGLMPGRFTTERRWAQDAAVGDTDAARRSAERSIPLRRSGSPDEFAAVATFILSPVASFLTGAMIPVDGGALRTL